MNILLSGGNGLIGKALSAKLTERQHNIRILTRNKPQNPFEFQWDIPQGFIDPKAFENLDAIVHLAGASIGKKWTASYKNELFRSRIDSAHLLHKYCKENNVALKSFVSASGINYYGSYTSEKILDENSEIQSDFLADLCVAWENAAFRFHEIAERTVCIRTSMVLSSNGGAFDNLKKIATFNLSSPLGSGKQRMNWIHLEDLVNLYVFALENPEMRGSYNAVADEIPTQREFMKFLSASMRKIFIPINVPPLVLKILLGEMSSLLLYGTRASNKKIKSAGFDFTYNTLEKAFSALLQKS